MKKIAPLFILAAGILWGCIGIFVRRLNAMGLYSMDIVFLRAVATALAMGVFLLLFNRQMFRIRLKDLWCFIGTGICSIVFFNFCYFKAMTLTSLSVAAVLLYTAPAIVMVLSFFLFGEKFTGRKVLALVMTFVGCVLVTGILTDGGNVTGMGILTGLGAGLGYALYSIFSRFALERGYHSFTITFYTFLIAIVGAAFLADVKGVAAVASKDLPTMAFCLSFGIACTVIPYLLYTAGLQYVENGKASIIASIEPVTATILGIVLFAEKMTLTGMAGVVIVIVALAIANKKEEKSAEK